MPTQPLGSEERLVEDMATHSRIQPTLGKSHGQRSLVGYSSWGCTELDTTEVTEKQQQQGMYVFNCPQTFASWSSLLKLV